MRLKPKLLPVRAANAPGGVRAPLLVACAALALGGCASTSAPFENWLPYISQFGVYKIDINQGNYLSQDMVDKLKEGQTKQQVRLVLGTPLITSVFRDDRWDYMYEYRKNGRVQIHRQFTVYFKGDALTRWEGDEMPPPPAEVARSGGGDAVLDKSLSTAPKTGEESWLQQLLRKLGWWQ